MPVSVIALIYRNPNLSPEEFKIRYEAHVELIKRVAGDTFPLVHRRRYLARTSSLDVGRESEGEGGRTKSEGRTDTNCTTPATLLAGQQSDFEFDVMVELTFEDQPAVDAFSARIYSPSVMDMLKAEEEAFMDRGRLGVVLVSEVVETSRVQ